MIFPHSLAYETPSKIILQIYCQLLKAHQQEARSLVREGLNTLLPVLDKKLPPEDRTWITLVKKVMLEEGYSLPQLTHILQLIVRHPDLFYPYCHQFISTMINSLHRIGLIPNASSENKNLTLAVVELILQWDTRWYFVVFFLSIVCMRLFIF